MIQLNLTEKSNQTNHTVINGGGGIEDPVISALSIVDSIVRVISASIFVIYFILVAVLKEMRSKNLFYVHHANFVGFLFVLMYLFYFRTSMPSTGNVWLNDILCRVTESVWGILKYLRSYSVLWIAIYRLTAVKHMNAFRFINKTKLNLLAPILTLWVLAIVLYVSTKFVFGVSYGSPFCIDGFSNRLDMTIGYLTVSSFLAILFPFGSISVIYALIRAKLKQNEAKLSTKKPSQTKSRAHDSDSSLNQQQPQVRPMKRQELNKNKKFSYQLISLNICYIFSLTVSFIVSF